MLNSVRSGLFLKLVGATVCGLLVTALCHNVSCEVSETTMLQKRASRRPRTNRSPNTEELLQHALEQEDAGPPKPLRGHYLKSLNLSSSLQVLQFYVVQMVFHRCSYAIVSLNVLHGASAARKS